MVSKEKLAELTDLVNPVIQWISDNCDPHTVVIVDYERFDLFQAVAGGTIGYYKKD